MVAASKRVGGKVSAKEREENKKRRKGQKDADSRRKFWERVEWLLSQSIGIRLGLEHVSSSATEKRSANDSMQRVGEGRANGRREGERGPEVAVQTARAISIIKTEKTRG